MFSEPQLIRGLFARTKQLQSLLKISVWTLKVAKFQADVETSSIILDLTNNKSVASVSRSASPLRHYRVLRLLIEPQARSNINSKESWAKRRQCRRLVQSNTDKWILLLLLIKFIQSLLSNPPPPAPSCWTLEYRLRTACSKRVLY